MNSAMIERLLLSRSHVVEELELPSQTRKCEEEGGCGVVGFCCTEPVPARHIHEPSRQMHNRGNGKGGGIAALGFIPEQLGVNQEVLNEYYMIHIAFLNPEIRSALERKYIAQYLDIAVSHKLETIDDWVSFATGQPPAHFMHW